MARIDEYGTRSGIAYKVSWDLPRTMIPPGQKRAKGSLTVYTEAQASLAKKIAEEAKHAILGNVVFDVISQTLAPEVPQEPQGLTLNAWAEEFIVLKRRGSTSQRSQAADEIKLREVVLPLLGHKLLSDITGEDIENFCYAIKNQRNVKNATVDRYYALIKHMLNVAINKRKLEAYVNPAKTSEWKVGVREIEDDEEKNAERYFTAEQYNDLLAQFRPDYRLFVGFMGNTGARFSEVTELRVRDLNWTTNKATIWKSSKVSHSGKQLAPGKPKSLKSRVIEVPPTLMEELKAHIEGLGPHDYVFRGSRGGRISNSNFRRDHWNPAMAKLRQCPQHPPTRIDGRSGLAVYSPKEPSACSCLGPMKWTSYSPHTLRHSYATWIIFKGGSLALLSVQLGHSSMAFTQQQYVHQIQLSAQHNLSGLLGESFGRRSSSEGVSELAGLAV